MSPPTFAQQQQAVASSIANAASRFAWLESVPTTEVSNMLHRLTQAVPAANNNGSDGISGICDTMFLSERLSRSQAATAACVSHDHEYVLDSSKRGQHTIVELDPSFSLDSLATNLVTMPSGDRGKDNVLEESPRLSSSSPRPNDDMASAKQEPPLPAVIMTRSTKSSRFIINNDNMDHNKGAMSPPALTATVSERLCRSHKKDPLLDAICKKLSTALLLEGREVDHEQVVLEALASLVLSSPHSSSINSSHLRQTPSRQQDNDHQQLDDSILPPQLLRSKSTSNNASPHSCSSSSSPKTKKVLTRHASTTHITRSRSTSCSPKVDRSQIKKRLLSSDDDDALFGATLTTATMNQPEEATQHNGGNKESTSDHNGGNKESTTSDRELLLAKGWKKARDAATGRYYYYTLDHSRVVWDHPLHHPSSTTTSLPSSFTTRKPTTLASITASSTMSCSSGNTGMTSKTSLMSWNDDEKDDEDDDPFGHVVDLGSSFVK
jgi:hypothetical protein